ncbi:MAG: small subunit ribosomal protein [Thermoplasmata archaeon]|jgi:small subunit ribosomal protein S9|nr:small subunit ribosomal protein [Thermoplasmata archaeon]HUR61604.1 30S ribosomal protein S9 [Candidatus Thermoplasmatota archaeon]
MAKKVVNTSGKRKTAVARAAAVKGSGKVRVNQVPIEIVEPKLARLKMEEPLLVAGKKAEKLDITVSVAGGGVYGQADAVRTAIARAILDYTEDAELKEQYLAYDRTLLVNDTRVKESKKPLGRGARKKRQKSYR